MRLPRYSVRALLIALTVAAAFFAWAGDRMEQNRKAGAITERLHCRCFDGGRFPKIAYWLPAPVTGVLWPPHLNNDVTFGLSPASDRVQLRDSDLCELSQLRHLHTLSILPANVDPQSPITDAGIVCLSQCQELSTLGITSSRMTDDGLEAIGGIKSLQELRLHGTTAITGQGLRHLARLPGLIKLGLFDTPVTDEAVKFIARIESLRIVRLEGTHITGAAGDRLRALLPKALIEGPSEAAEDNMIVPKEAIPYLNW